jgi:monoamine oxidase
MSKASLIGKTLLELSKEVCGEDAAKAALSSFGYTTEFLKMNAYDAIALMGIIAKPQKYFVLGGGLSQIIERLKTRLVSMGCRFEMGREVVGIQEAEDIYTIFCHKGSSIESSRCVCTFPAKNVLNLKFAGSAEYRHRMSEWKRIVKDSVYEGSLCRIYSVFPPSVKERVKERDKERVKERDKSPWFAGLGKITMNNPVRMIIPIDEEKGVVMISYTDGVIADKWAKIESEKGIREVNRRLKEIIDSELNISIPMPKHTRIFHWSNGVGYWKVGADSAAVENRATRGFGGMHFCGENYSAKNQQWIEGSLDTADLVFKELN